MCPCGATDTVGESGAGRGEVRGLRADTQLRQAVAAAGGRPGPPLLWVTGVFRSSSHSQCKYLEVRTQAFFPECNLTH